MLFNEAVTVLYEKSLIKIYGENAYTENSIFF